MVLARGSTLMDLLGVGARRRRTDPRQRRRRGARFADRNRLASWTGTASWTSSGQIRRWTGAEQPSDGSSVCALL